MQGDGGDHILSKIGPERRQVGERRWWMRRRRACDGAHCVSAHHCVIMA